MMLGLFGFGLMVAYVPWINGAGSTPRWAVIVIGACAVLFAGPIKITWAHILGALFVGWSLLTLTWAPIDGMDAAWKLIALACLFMVGSTLRDLRPIWVGAAAGLAVSSLLVIADVGGLISYQQYARPSGLFVNGLYLAEAAAMVMVGLITVHLGTAWSLMAGLAILPSLLLVSLPRGPWLAIGAAGLVAIWGRSRRWAITGALMATAGVGWAVALRPETVTARLAMWSDAAWALTPFGSGLGSYYSTAPVFARLVDVTASREYHPHNDLLEIALGTGIPGLLLALAFLAVLFFAHTNEDRYGARLVMVVFVAEGCFGFPLSLPATAGLAAIVSGFIAGGLPHWRHQADDGGIPLRGGDGGAGPTDEFEPSNQRWSTLPVNATVPIGASDVPIFAGGSHTGLDAGGCQVSVNRPAS